MNAVITFRLSPEKLKELDEAAVADHRDRTSMLNKIIAFYFENNPEADGKKPSAARKKAGIR